MRSRTGAYALRSRYVPIQTFEPVSDCVHSCIHASSEKACDTSSTVERPVPRNMTPVIEFASKRGSPSRGLMIGILAYLDHPRKEND